MWLLTVVSTHWSLEGSFTWYCFGPAIPSILSLCLKTKGSIYPAGKIDLHVSETQWGLTLLPHFHEVSHTNRWPHGWSMSKGSPALSAGTGMVSEPIPGTLAPVRPQSGPSATTKSDYFSKKPPAWLWESLVGQFYWLILLSQLILRIGWSHQPPKLRSHWLILELNCLWLVSSENSPFLAKGEPLHHNLNLGFSHPIRNVALSLSFVSRPVTHKCSRLTRTPVWILSQAFTSFTSVDQLFRFSVPRF